MNDEVLKLIVPRVGYDEQTFAVLHCYLMDKVTCASDLRRALIAAVRRWTQTTDEGRQALEGNNGDFNLGDVALYDEALLPFIEEEGVQGFSIDVFSSDTPISGWEYDDNLADDDDADEADEEEP